MVLVVDRFSRSAVVFIGAGLSLHILPPVLHVQAPRRHGVEAAALQVEEGRRVAWRFVYNGAEIVEGIRIVVYMIDDIPIFRV